MKLFSKNYFLTLLCVITMLYFNCHLKRSTLGSQNKIIVIADSTEWLQIENQVTAILERTVYTPQPEPIFTLLHKQPQGLKKVVRFPNILLLATLESEGMMKNLVDQLLTPESRIKVEQDSAFLFNREDAWAIGQLLVVGIAKDNVTLKKRLDQDKDVLFNIFDSNTAKQTNRALFIQHEQEEISETLMAEHGWSVRVQHDYYVAVDSSDIRFVWLRRFNPQRWLAVYWESVEDPSVLSKEWILEKRNDFVEKFYDGDYVYQDSLIQVLEKIVDFNGRYAIRLDGVWQNDKHIMGGPFRTFGFYNQSDGRMYLIDLAVYAPGERKYPYIRQLEGIAASFKTKESINE